MNQTNYELRVGLFALFAIILLLWGWSWLKSFSIWRQPQRFTVKFHDIAGLNNNGTVNINGVRVGTVEKIELKSKGVVYVHLKITAENITVPRGSRITIQTLGLVGAKYVEITLPEPKADQPPPPPLEPTEVVAGQDPVRLELIMNDLATRVQDWSSYFTPESSKGLNTAFLKSGETVEEIYAAAKRLNQNADSLKDMASSIRDTSGRFGKVADNANQFFRSGSNSFQDIGELARNLKGTAKRIDRLLGNPNLSGDLKEAMNSVRQTATTVANTIEELNSSLKDKELRSDLSSILARVNDSTENIHKSLVIVERIGTDAGLRTDVKEVIANAKEAMDRLNQIFADPSVKQDFKQTMSKIRAASNNVDLAARQLHEILDKRFPLFHLMLGRPGHIGEEPVVPEKAPSSGPKSMNHEILQLFQASTNPGPVTQ